jgi:glycosyltransferase involved in cell wall biosynthesis
VLASPVHRQAIEATCLGDNTLNGIQWVFPQVKAWQLQPGIEPRWERTYNLLWQRSALRLARELHRRVRFEAIHHLTWGGVRAPTFLGSLDVPLIMGPIGGGETSPLLLRDGFGLRAKVTEAIRDLSNATITINPMLCHGLTRAAVIFARTSDTRGLLSTLMQKKSITFSELSLFDDQISKSRTAQRKPPRIIYAGRLLYWKGVHIGIRAFAELSRSLPDARFTIVGTGPEEARLRTDAATYGVAGKIDFIPWLERERLFDLYAHQDLLLFPSLHDSGGTVVLEALSQGLPVVCLGLGGPRDIVTPASGIVIDTSGRNTAEVAAAMADEMLRLFGEPARLTALSEGAIARARQFILSDRVAELYGHAVKFIEACDRPVGPGFPLNQIAFGARSAGPDKALGHRGITY